MRAHSDGPFQADEKIFDKCRRLQSLRISGRKGTGRYLMSNGLFECGRINLVGGAVKADETSLLQRRLGISH